MAGRAWNWWSGGLRRYRRAARAMQGSTLICRVIRCERDAMEFGDHEGQPALRDFGQEEEGACLGMGMMCKCSFF